MALDFSIQLPDLNQPRINIECYKWIKENGLLRKNRVCVKCRGTLILSDSADSPNYDCLKCCNHHCERKNLEISSLMGSFFGPLALDLSKWLHVINLWCHQESIPNVGRELGIDFDIVHEAYKSCRTFCAEYLEAFPMKLSQRVIVKKHAFYLSKGLYWVLLILGIGSGKTDEKVIYMKEIELNISLFALMSIIKNVVEKGSEIISDEFGKPPIMEADNFTFRNCNDDDDRICQLYIERLKNKIAVIGRAKPKNREAYLKECMWRDRAEGNLYQCFIENLKTYYNYLNEV